MKNLLNGLHVYRRDGTMFIALPQELWAQSGFSGQCKCGKCDGSGMWDTLAITEPLPNDGTTGRSFTYTVHYPSLQQGQL